MAVEFVIDSLEGLDEPLKGAYTEKDGKFQLDVDKYAEFKKLPLIGKNKELIGKLNEAKTGLKRFEKLAELEDDDLAELLELREHKNQNGDKDKPDAAAAKAQKAQEKIAAKHAAEKTALETQLGDLQRENKHYKLTLPVRDAALKAGVFPEDLDVVMLDTSKRFSLGDDNKIVVLDEDGDPTDITPQKYFETLYKEQRPKFFKASGAGGSGAQNNTAGKSGGQKVIKRTDWDGMSTTERSAFSKDGGKVVD